jgi:hypothetical protein
VRGPIGCDKNNANGTHKPENNIRQNGPRDKGDVRLEAKENNFDRDDGENGARRNGGVRQRDAAEMDQSKDGENGVRRIGE